MKLIIFTLISALSLQAWSCADLPPGSMPPRLDTFIQPNWQESYGSDPHLGVAEAYVDIDKEGKVTKVELKKVTPDSIPAEMLINSIKRSKFIPAIVDGKSISATKHLQTFEFSLE